MITSTELCATCARNTRENAGNAAAIPAVAINSGYVTVDFSGVPARYRAPFSSAAQRWNEIIMSPKRQALINGVVQTVGVHITATVRPIDGPNGILGQAGPREVLQSDGLPVNGIMDFDEADVESMLQRGTLQDVILHEMGHVLGSGTLWEHKGLIQGIGTNDPVFIGANAVSQYRALTNNPNAQSVPAANTGGQGTRDSHWREGVFGDELLTGFISGNTRPLSRMSIASLIDLGYQANLLRADPYSMPQVGSWLPALVNHEEHKVIRPQFTVVPDAGGLIIGAAA